MKQSAFFTSVLSDLKLPQTQLENIINYRLRKERIKPRTTGTNKRIAFMEYEGITTYSTQVAIKGNVSICLSDNRKEVIERCDVPMTAFFLVTCNKGKKDWYRVGVCASLS